MKVQCQNCGQEVMVNGIGRPKLNLDGVKVYTSLQANGSVTATAKEFHCSRASIRNAIKVLSKDKGLKL
jgi:hypothetical protein